MIHLKIVLLGLFFFCWSKHLNPIWIACVVSLRIFVQHSRNQQLAWHERNEMLYLNKISWYLVFRGVYNASMTKTLCSCLFLVTWMIRWDTLNQTIRENPRWNDTFLLFFLLRINVSKMWQWQLCFPTFSLPHSLHPSLPPFLWGW